MSTPDSSANADPATNPNPDVTPGLAPGGGVRPGDTPPAEASATSGLADGQPAPPTGGAGTFRLVGIVLAVLAVVVVVGVVVWAFLHG